MGKERSLRPQADRYPDQVERAVRALLSDGKEAGAEALESIRYEPREVGRRRTPPSGVRARVLIRDRFHCRYCGGKTIFEPVMALLGYLYPGLFPYDAHWRGGVTHPAIISRSPLIDHVDPGSSSGTWLDIDNLVTACNPCNAIKADLSLEQLGWKLRPISRSRWDGLSGLYPDLWVAAGRPNPPFHVRWMTDLGLDVPDDRGR